MTMNRLDIGHAIHSYRPPEPPKENVVLDCETPLGRAMIIRDHWHAPGLYKAFVKGCAVEPRGFSSYEEAQQALRIYLERAKTERMAFLRKQVRQAQEALRALKLFEPGLVM